MCWFRNAKLLFPSQVRSNKTIPQGFKKYKKELTVRNKVLFYSQRLEIYSMFVYDAAFAAKHFNLFINEILNDKTLEQILTYVEPKRKDLR